MTFRSLVFSLVLFCANLCFATDAQEPLKAYQVVSVSQSDVLVVIKSPDGHLGTFTVGDLIPTLPYEIMKIADDRVVFRDQSVPVDVVILYLYQEGLGSRFQRISPRAPDNISAPSLREYDLTRAK